MTSAIDFLKMISVLAGHSVFFIMAFVEFLFFWPSFFTAVFFHVMCKRFLDFLFSFHVLKKKFVLFFSFFLALEFKLKVLDGCAGLLRGRPGSLESSICICTINLISICKSIYSSILSSPRSS